MKNSKRTQEVADRVRAESVAAIDEIPAPERHSRQDVQERYPVEHLPGRSITPVGHCEQDRTPAERDENLGRSKARHRKPAPQAGHSRDDSREEERPIRRVLHDDQAKGGDREERERVERAPVHQQPGEAVQADANSERETGPKTDPVA